MATGVGSLPHRNPKRASEIVLNNFPEAPFWPQLPRRSFVESMWIQYSEGLPGAVVDEEKEKVYVDIDNEFLEKLAEFYQRTMDGDLSYFAISRRYAPGLYAMLKLLEEERPEAIKLIKGQVTGPVSMGLTLTTKDKKSIIYHDIAADAIVQLLASKGAWQERLFREALPEIQTLIFFDEPYLAGYGSAFFSVEPIYIVKYLNKCFNALSGMKGIHCCGNTDWGLLLKTGLDVINFDAYNYGENFILYQDEIYRFIEEGKIIAWGIIPTDEKKLRKEDAKTLIERIEKLINKLVERGVDEEKLINQSMITPSCGTGSMSEKAAEKALSLTREVSERLRYIYFGTNMESPA